MSRFRLSAVFFVFCIAFVLPAGATDYYVSPSGNDAFGDGSQGRPWRTIQRAANDMWAGDTCHVADGTYEEMVLPPRSGAPGQYISFVAEGSSVYVRGTRQITGWTVHSGNIWKANVGWTFGELFVDGQRMVLARWPNLTSGDLYRPNFYQATANGGKTSIIDSAHLTQPSGYWSGAKIFMVPGLGWIADQRDVTGYDPASHRITFSPAISFSDYYDADQYSLYYMYDKLSLLDATSEWFLDRASGTVYLWLPDGGNPNNHLVESSGGSGGFDLNDRSYIRIAGFKLMSGAIKMLNATGCRVEEVQHLYPATELSVSGSDNVITRSEIAYAGYSGVKLGGIRNTLSQCHVHHCAYLGKPVSEFTGPDSIVVLGVWGYWPPVVCSQNSIVDCSLHDAGRDVVSTIGGQEISACVIEHNEIYNAGLISKDLGGFYTWGTDGKGTVIRYNIVHDIWPQGTPQYASVRVGNGIYLDNGSSNFLVHHNLVYRTPLYAIMMNDPSINNLVYNNTAVGSSSSGGSWGDAIYTAGQVNGVVLANNLAVVLDGRKGWDNQLGWCIHFESAVPAYHHNGYYNPLTNSRLNSQGLEGTAVTGNPLFTCADGNDFSLLVGSPMIDRGAVIPGITDGYVGAAPDIGAYERGASERPGPRDEWWLPSQTLTLQAGAGGTTNPGPGAYTLKQGRGVCVTAVPNDRYRFKNWSGDASGDANPTTVTMAGNKTVTANFVRQYTLTIAAGSNGTTNPVPGTYTYDEGASVSIQAAPASAYQLDTWTGDASGSANPLTVVMNGNKTVQANFSRAVKPPLALTGEKIANRSLSMLEHIVRLKWQVNAANTGAISYRIYQIENGQATALADVAVGTLEYSIRKLQATRAYRFGVTAVNSQGWESEIAEVAIS